MREWKTFLIALRYAGRHAGIRLALLCLSGSLLLLLLSTAIWGPLYYRYSGLQHEVQAMISTMAEHEKNRKFSSIYARSKQSMHEISLKLNRKLNQSEHVKQLDKMLRDRRINVINEVYDSEKLTQGYTRLSQELLLQGGYKELRQFLMDLDSLPSWTVVQEIRIEKNTASGANIKAGLKMVTYYVEG